MPLRSEGQSHGSTKPLDCVRRPPRRGQRTEQPHSGRGGEKRRGRALPSRPSWAERARGGVSHGVYGRGAPPSPSRPVSWRCGEGGGGSDDESVVPTPPPPTPVTHTHVTQRQRCVRARHSALSLCVLPPAPRDLRHRPWGHRTRVRSARCLDAVGGLGQRVTCAQSLPPALASEGNGALGRLVDAPRRRAGRECEWSEEPRWPLLSTEDDHLHLKAPRGESPRDPRGQGGGSGRSEHGRLYWCHLHGQDQNLLAAPCARAAV